MDDTLTYKIAIVGFGPKGLYGFERLLAQLNLVSITKPVEIHIFNNTQFFAAGDVYRNDQPEYLIMNYTNRNINVWPTENPKPILNDTPDFVTWLKKKGFSNAEVDDFAPRSFVGEYLMHCFQDMADRLPYNIKVIPHVGFVSNVENRSNTYKLTWRNSNSMKSSRIMCQKVLFTTGHVSFKSQAIEKVKSNYLVDFIYPTNEKLKHIHSNSTVALKGMGLTSIDAILTLTEGRGGVFEKDNDGNIIYQKSGKEPKVIYGFSRTGLPMLPRDGSESSTSKLQYFTKNVIEKLQNNKPIDFSSTLLLLIKKEFYFAFYSTLFKKHGHSLSFNLDFTVIENQVKLFHQEYPKSEVFSWDNIINPFKDEKILSTELLQKYFEYLIQEAQLGEKESPFMAAVATWRKISPDFNQIYSYGGLDADSHREFDSYYFGLFNRLAYGPPLKNMKKILALINCELLDLTFAKAATIIQNEKHQDFQLVRKDKLKKSSINFLINATIPRANENSFENELYQNLRENGHIEIFENTSKTRYKPGCLSINENGNPIDKSGRVNIDFTFYGTPTEGVTFDNDTLSRTRNDFASTWAEKTCEAILIREGRKEIYEREKHLL